MPNSGDAQLLLKVNEALLLAKDENDILSCIALQVDDTACLRLIYLERSVDGDAIEVVRVTASWKANRLWIEDPMLRQSIEPPGNKDPVLARIVFDAGLLKEQIWFIDDLRSIYAVPETPFSIGTCSLILVKLYSVDILRGTLWSAALCISWPTEHQYTNDEAYTLSMLSQTVSAVIANRRKLVSTVSNLEKLQEIDRLKTQFLQMVSHEMRTPLSGIIATTDGLLHGTAGELSHALQKDISLIQSSSEHLLRVISDLLDMAKIEAGQLTLNLEDIDFKPIAEHVLQEAAIFVQGRDIRLMLEIADDLPDVRVDATRIHQVLLNLISNAIKFSDHGKIQIRTRIKEDTLIVSVTDEGIGIDAAYLTEIFEPFQQVNPHVTIGIDGSGLGLSICKNLVELHGGQIWVESTSNQGSTFSFSLPLPRPDRIS